MALCLYRQSLDHTRSVLGEDHPEIAIVLQHLSHLYIELGFSIINDPGFRPPNTWSWHLLEFNRRHFGEDHPVYPEGVDSFVESCLGAPTGAEPFFLMSLEFAIQAAEISRNALGEKHPSYAHAVQSLGLIYHLLGNDQAAENYYREALKSATRPREGTTDTLPPV